MISPRSACPIAATLDLIGDRWSLLVLRDVLVEGAESFSEIGAAEGIATNILSARLKHLTEAGLLSCRPHPDDGRRKVYRPTEASIGLIPVLLDLTVWGDAHTACWSQAAEAAAIRADREGVLAELSARARVRLATDDS